MNPSCRSGLRSRAGVSLIELVVSMAVISLMLTAGFAALSSVMDHRQRVDRATEEVMRAAAVRSTLLDWLAGARLVADERGPEFRGHLTEPLLPPVVRR